MIRALHEGIQFAAYVQYIQLKLVKNVLLNNYLRRNNTTLFRSSTF